MIKLAEKILDRTSELVSSEEFVNTHKTTAKCFLRNRVLGFKNIMGICLNFSKRTLQVEIDDYFDNLNSEDTVTKQAFSKQRTFISPIAFIELFNVTVDAIFKNKSIKTFKGHRFFAIDGSMHQLPRNKESAEYFGTNPSSSIPEARVSALCDVLSNFLIHTEIDSNKVDERTLAKRHLGQHLTTTQKNNTFPARIKSCPKSVDVPYFLVPEHTQLNCHPRRTVSQNQVCQSTHHI